MCGSNNTVYRLSLFGYFPGIVSGIFVFPKNNFSALCISHVCVTNGNRGDRGGFAIEVHEIIRVSFTGTLFLMSVDID